jgi:hypothetical protein
MNEHNLAAVIRKGLRRWCAGMAVLAVPVVLMSAVSVGTASAHEGHDHGDEGGGWTATTPVDAFADHWEEHHKGKDPASEPSTIASDPNNYVAIHQEMAENALPH